MTSVVGHQILFSLSNGKWIQGLLIFKLLEVINMQLLPIISNIIQQAGNENTQTYKLEVVIWILLQILVTNL